MDDNNAWTLNCLFNMLDMTFPHFCLTCMLSMLLGFFSGEKLIMLDFKPHKDIFPKEEKVIVYVFHQFM